MRRKYNHEATELVLIICLIFLSSLNLWAEDIFYRVIEDTPVWQDESFKRQSNAARVLLKGSIVTEGQTAVYLSSIDDIDTYFSSCIYDGENYSIPIAALVPAETKNLFADSFLTHFNNKNREYWIVDYYLDVLQSLDRHKMYTYEHAIIDAFNKGQQQEEYPKKWWQQFNGNDDCLLIFQSVIEIGGISLNPFWIRNIRETASGYQLIVQGEKMDNDYYFDWSETPFSWPKNSDETFFSIALVADGDYLDIYLDSTDKKIASFAKVDKTFMDEMENLFVNNTADISKITWPKRADGRMDYPLTNKKLLESYTPTHRTSTALRLRADASTKAGYFATLQEGENVQVIEVGRTETIDTISAPWVHVLTEKGFYGWCFSGYLKKIPKMALSELPPENEGCETSVMKTNG